MRGLNFASGVILLAFSFTIFTGVSSLLHGRSADFKFADSRVEDLLYELVFLLRRVDSERLSRVAVRGQCGEGETDANTLALACTSPYRIAWRDSRVGAMIEDEGVGVFTVVRDESGSETCRSYYAS